MQKLLPITFGLVAMMVINTLSAKEVLSQIEDQTSIAVTIYNENLALVRDQRTVTLDVGEQDVAIRDVSAQIRPETAILVSLDQQAEWKLLEQNFNYDLLTPFSLLEKYVGEMVRAVTVNPATGNETIEEAEVLAVNDGVVLKFADRIETRFPGRLIFDQVPAKLRDRPTLVLKINNANPAPQNIQLSYLTSGLSWHADYVASLNQAETAIDLNGWVTLNNQSGTSYPDALLQLVAGEVNQVQKILPRARNVMALESVAADAMVAEESLFDYHLYTLPRPTSIGDKQTKQVALLSASSVPVSKQYLTIGQGHFFGGPTNSVLTQDVSVFLEFGNDEENGLGVPLPQGIMRVYKNDSAGRVQFIGEDRVDHTPRNEDIKLKLGNAFDITVERVQTSFRKVKNVGQYRFSAEIAQEITIKNAKDTAVTVTLRENIPGDWEIFEESVRHQKASSNLAEWEIEVPANGHVEMAYHALVRY